MATGHTQGMETCEFDIFTRICTFFSSLRPPQDCQLLLQEHCLYWCSLVVPDLLWLELTIVRLRTCYSFSLLLNVGVQCFRVYLPPVVELVLDDRAGHCHRFVRPYRRYVVLCYRGRVGIHPSLQTTTF